MILLDTTIKDFACFVLIIVVSIVFLRFIKTYLTFYSRFPNIFFLRTILRSILLRENSKNIPATSFYFQMWLNLIKERQRDGFCFLWLHTPYLVVNNAEAIKFFMNEPSAAYKPPIYGLFKEHLGESLLSSNGDLWKKQRKMLNQLFKTGALKSKISIINRNSNRLVESLSNVPLNTPVMILEYLKLSAFLNIFEFLSNIDCSSPERQEEIKRCMLYVEKAFEMMYYRMTHPWFLPKFTLHLFSKGREFLKDTDGEELGKKLMQELLDSSKRKMSEFNDASHEKDGRTFGELIVEYLSRDPSLTLEDMKHNFYNILIGGYDTLAYTLMWCIFMLGQYSEVQNQVYNELQSVMVNDTLSYDDLQRLKYLDCVIKETTRLYPVAPIFARHLQKTVKFRDNTIPKGTNLVFIPYLCQRDPAFFPNPDKFEPERFLEENNYNYPFIAFADGIRNCLGKKFAFMEMKILIAHIIKKFQVTSVEKIEDIQLTWKMFLRTEQPLHVRLKPRQ